MLRCLLEAALNQPAYLVAALVVVKWGGILLLT